MGCYQDCVMAVGGLTFDHTQHFVSTYPWLGGNRTDTIDFGVSLSLTRVTFADKGIIPPLQGISGVGDFLDDNEFFLISDCCCPCKWIFVAKIAELVSGVGEFDIAIEYPDDPGMDKSGTYQLDATVSFGIISNALCGLGQIYAAQSAYWPTFDGVTGPDPAQFVDPGIAFVLPTRDYAGSPELDGIEVAPINSIVSPYNLVANTGYYFFYNADLTAIEGVGAVGDNHGFREPCDATVSFNQGISWDMDRHNEIFDFDVNGIGNATLTVSFG